MKSSQRRQAAKRKAARQAALTPRPCEHCGQQFKPKRKDARFCCTKCRVYGSRARKREDAKRNTDWFDPGWIKYGDLCDDRYGGRVICSCGYAKDYKTQHGARNRLKKPCSVCGEWRMYAVFGEDTVYDYTDTRSFYVTRYLIDKQRDSRPPEPPAPMETTERPKYDSENLEQYLKQYRIWEEQFPIEERGEKLFRITTTCSHYERGNSEHYWGLQRQEEDITEEVQRKKREAEERRKREEQKRRLAEKIEKTFQRKLAELREPNDSMKLLGITDIEDEPALKAAYRNKAVQCHPDHNGSGKEFRELQAALEDCKKRRARIESLRTNKVFDEIFADLADV